MEHFYPVLVTIHLVCAIVFAGTIAFEVLIFESFHANFDATTIEKIERATVLRAQKFMPFVVAALFVSGFGMMAYHIDSFADFFASGFGVLFGLKVVLAFMILGIFVVALTLFALNKMKPKLFKVFHLAAFAIVFAIATLAKVMMYI